jgi:hypothetical protein
MQQKVKYSILLILLAILAMTLLPMDGPMDAPRNATRLEISKMYLAIQYEEFTNHTSIVGVLLRRKTNQQDFNSMLAEFLQKEGQPARFRTGNNARLQVIDRWGNPFLVCTSNEAVTLRLPKKMLDAKRLVIWSAGPNGKNEFGRGDDIFLQ